MTRTSYWQQASMQAFPPRTLPRRVDVIVVGGGITGLTAAHLLKSSGKRVALFEKDRIGSGETARTSAHLTHVTDVTLTDLVKRFGDDAARLVWSGGETAIDLIESQVETLGIDCGFQRVPNFLSAKFNRDGERDEDLEAEAATARRLGFAARYETSGPIAGRPAVAYPDQAIFHPLQYLDGLARAVDGDGSMVAEQSEVMEVIDDPLTVVVNGEPIECDYLVIATHAPLMGKSGVVRATLFQTKLYPYSTYVVGARLPKGAMRPLLCSDTDDPYYYLRVHEDEEGPYAIFGGADHKTGQADDTARCFDDVERMLLRLIPDATVDRRWSGQVIETSDGLPFMGETSEQQFVATGYAGNGLTFGTLAGLMAHDAALGVGNPWRELFEPTRKDVRALGTIVAENIDYPLHFIADRLRRRSGTTSEALRAGEGALLSLDGQRVAAYRTNDGTLVRLNPSCTHMGCLVRWNASESTWDCPCHGSRFTAEGEVLGGPAEEPLERLDS
jgi:glycine/D-amino acid oxidase-like deaminating enzyme/nitrite reductase/ring-hydroxylating ferredoxin subunit